MRVGCINQSKEASLVQREVAANAAGGIDGSWLTITTPGSWYQQYSWVLSIPPDCLGRSVPPLHKGGPVAGRPYCLCLGSLCLPGQREYDSPGTGLAQRGSAVGERRHSARRQEREWRLAATALSQEWNNEEREQYVDFSHRNLL